MKYLQLDYSIIQSKYPRSLDKVISWFASRDDLVTYLKRGGADDVLKVIKEQMVPMVIQHDPRKLYELFDQLDIMISITKDDYNPFSFHCSNNKMKISNMHSSRIDAEQSAFMQAFDYLESTLINGEG